MQKSVALIGDEFGVVSVSCRTRGVILVKRTLFDWSFMAFVTEKLKFSGLTCFVCSWPTEVLRFIIIA